MIQEERRITLPSVFSGRLKVDYWGKTVSCFKYEKLEISFKVDECWNRTSP